MNLTQMKLERWCEAEGIDFRDTRARDAYMARARRVADAVLLRPPDRVPVVPTFGMFPALFSGYTCEEVMFDYGKAHEAWVRTALEFQPDLFQGASYAYPGRVLEALGYRPLRIPGRGVPADQVYQFVEDEYVRAEEFYDHFTDDPTDFMLRVYLPRVCSRLSAISGTRPVVESFGYYLLLVANLASWGSPDVVEAMEAFMEASREALRWATHIRNHLREIQSMGFPIQFGSASAAPFDIIGDWFRGTRGVMVDMFRNPDKLLKAMERLVPILIRMAVERARSSSHPIVGLMLHKGAEGFMSLEQFRTFYWPPLKEVMKGIMDEGLVPMPLFEGEYTSRLEVIREIPEAKAIYWFERVDLPKARDALRGRVCFKGNVPVTLLYAGSPDDVRDYVRELIDLWGREGGLIVDCGIWFDEARAENVRAMVEFTKSYGAGSR